MIEKPHGTGLVKHRGKWTILYYEDGKRKQKSTGVSDKIAAEILRDSFLHNKPVRKRQLVDKADKYIYKSNHKKKPWLVKINGVVVGTYESMETARIERNIYLEQYEM